MVDSVSGISVNHRGSLEYHCFRRNCQIAFCQNGQNGQTSHFDHSEVLSFMDDASGGDKMGNFNDIYLSFMES